MSMTTAHNGVYKCRATNSKTGQYFDLKEYNVQNLASSGFYLQTNRIRYFRENVPNFNQLQARKHSFLASDWLRFGNLHQKYRILLVSNQF